MKRYHFDEQLQATYESMQVPFAIYQFINKRIVTIALSDGFCELFGYDDKAQAYHDMDHNMYKDTHPDDMARIEDAAFRFATEDGKGSFTHGVVMCIRRKACVWLTYGMRTREPIPKNLRLPSLSCSAP